MAREMAAPDRTRLTAPRALLKGGDLCPAVFLLAQMVIQGVGTFRYNRVDGIFTPRPETQAAPCRSAF